MARFLPVILIVAVVVLASFGIAALTGESLAGFIVGAVGTGASIAALALPGVPGTWRRDGGNRVKADHGSVAAGEDIVAGSINTGDKQGQPR